MERKSGASATKNAISRLKYYLFIVTESLLGRLRERLSIVTPEGEKNFAEAEDFDRTPPTGDFLNSD